MSYQNPIMPERDLRLVKGRRFAVNPGLGSDLDVVLQSGSPADPGPGGDPKNDKDKPRAPVLQSGSPADASPGGDPKNDKDRPRAPVVRGIADVGCPLAEYAGQPEPEAFVPWLAYPGMVTLLAGREGEGKTTLCAQAVAAVTAGLWGLAPWLRPGVELPAPDFGSRVIWITGDHADVGNTADDVDRLGGFSELVRVVPVSAMTSPDVLVELCRQVAATLVVVDPLADLLRVTEERSYTQARAKVNAWRPEYSTDAGLFRPALLGLLHMPKDSRDGRKDRILDAIGSVGQNSAADLLVSFEGLGRDLEDTRRRVSIRKSRLRSLRRGTSAVIDYVNRVYVEAAPRPAGSDVELRSRIDLGDLEGRARALRAAEPGLSLRQAAGRLGCGRGTNSAPYRLLKGIWLG